MQGAVRIRVTCVSGQRAHLDGDVRVFRERDQLVQFAERLVILLPARESHVTHDQLQLRMARGDLSHEMRLGVRHEQHERNTTLFCFGPHPVEARQGCAFLPSAEAAAQPQHAGCGSPRAELSRLWRRIVVEAPHCGEPVGMCPRRCEYDIVAGTIPVGRDQYGAVDACGIHFTQQLVSLQRLGAMGFLTLAPGALGSVGCPDMNLRVGDHHGVPLRMRNKPVTGTRPTAGFE